MGNNRVGKNEENYKGLSLYVNSLIDSKDYKEINTNTDRIIILRDIKNKEIGIGVTTGKFYNIVYENDKVNYIENKAGQNKSNNRSYISFALPDNEKYMLANYVAMMAVATLADKYDTKNKGCTWNDSVKHQLDYEINHASGDTEDNTYENLDVTPKALNLAHSRLMAELEYTMPGVYTTTLENGSHKFIGGNRVYGEQIDKFNRTHKTQIKAFKDKKGLFRPRFNKEEIKEMVKYFNLRECS